MDKKLPHPNYVHVFPHLTLTSRIWNTPFHITIYFTLPNYVLYTNIITSNLFIVLNFTIAYNTAY